MFESSVNSEGIETSFVHDNVDYLFESSVNSEGIETHFLLKIVLFSLRAV